MNNKFEYDFLRNREKFFSHALRFTKNVYSAEDLLQETALKVFRADPSRFTFGTNFIGWVYTIMRNIHINDCRRRTLEMKLVDSTDECHQDSQLSYSSVKNRADDYFLGQDLSKAFEGIDPIFLDPFLMYFEGYKYKEIAAYYGIPEGTVKTRIFSARKILKTRLKSYSNLKAVK
ncbi:RNA polymerase sigma factor [Sphingobacteruim zhuxiongii]|nr:MULTISPECIES: RNA polymerase sigma factor [unclassified Sphingobacterium]